MLVLAVAEVFASRLFRSIVFLSLSNHLLSSLVCWCSAFCHITAACVSGKVHYAIPVLLLFVARCTHQTVRQGHQQPIGGAKSGWRRNARALRDDGKTKQNGGQRRTGMGREGLVEQVDHPCIGICDKRLGHHLVTPEAAFTCASSLCLFSSLFSLLSSPFSLSS